MAQFSDTRRPAPWWMCAIMLLISAFFGWIIYAALSNPPKPGIVRYFLIPPYALWNYLLLACLLNKDSILATRDRVVLSSGPIPLGPSTTLPRHQIAFCYLSNLTLPSEESDGPPIILGQLPGIETTEGRQIVLTEPYKDPAAARHFAQSIANALNDGHLDRRIEVRSLEERRNDPVGTRRAWIWAGIWATAVALGIAWELLGRG